MWQAPTIVRDSQKLHHSKCVNTWRGITTAKYAEWPFFSHYFKAWIKHEEKKSSNYFSLLQNSVRPCIFTYLLHVLFTSFAVGICFHVVQKCFTCLNISIIIFSLLPHYCKLAPSLRGKVILSAISIAKQLQATFSGYYFLLFFSPWRLIVKTFLREWRASFRRRWRRKALMSFTVA